MTHVTDSPRAPPAARCVSCWAPCILGRLEPVRPSSMASLSLRFSFLPGLPMAARVYDISLLMRSSTPPSTSARIDSTGCNNTHVRSWTLQRCQQALSYTKQWCLQMNRVPSAVMRYTHRGMPYSSYIRVSSCMLRSPTARLTHHAP